MRVEGWWIFYGKNAYKMSVDSVPLEFKYPSKIDENFLNRFFRWLCSKEAGFMAMGYAEAKRRAKITERSAFNHNGVQLVPAAKGIIGNGFAFTWID